MNRALLSASLLLVAACGASAAAAQPSASPAPTPPRQCFDSHQLSSWRETSDTHVNLRVGVNDIYSLELLGPCPDLKWAEAIGIETRGGSDWICSGLDVTLIVPSSVTHTVPQRCMATSLRKLTKAEVDALPKGQKP